MTREMPLEAREHLLSVRPWATRDMFQTFAEAPNTQGAQCVLAPRWRLAPVLHRLNTARGHGIYFAPSDFDRGRRGLTDVTGIRHLWLDLDGTPLPES